MYRDLERRLVAHLREFLRRTYGLDLANIVVEQPPKIEFGEYALPIAFELARKLRKAPRKIAEEIVAGVDAIPGFEKFEVADDLRAVAATILVPLAEPEKGHDFLGSKAVLGECIDISGSCFNICYRY